LKFWFFLTRKKRVRWNEGAAEETVGVGELGWCRRRWLGAENLVGVGELGWERRRWLGADMVKGHGYVVAPLIL
jgi:hypothetical protein